MSDGTLLGCCGLGQRVKCVPPHLRNWRQHAVVLCDVNPLRSIKRRSSASVTVLPGLSASFARLPSGVTFTAVTPSTLCNATLTAYAQLVQSVPKMVKSSCRYSAEAVARISRLPGALERSSNEELALTLDAAVHITGRCAYTTAAITCRENSYNLGNAAVRCIVESRRRISLAALTLCRQRDHPERRARRLRLAPGQPKGSLSRPRQLPTNQAHRPRIAKMHSQSLAKSNWRAVVPIQISRRTESGFRRKEALAKRSCSFGRSPGLCALRADHPRTLAQEVQR
jgi:hypothetical protein